MRISDWSSDVVLFRSDGSWDGLVRKARRRSGTVVISHEILAPAAPGQVARAMRDLAGSDIHVVYTVRDLARQLPAAWQRSEERRVGQACVSTGRSRWSPYHYKKKKRTNTRNEEN